MTPSQELRAAATKLRPSSPAVAAHTVAVRISPAAAEALADLLDTAAEYVADDSPSHPTHLVRALAVARAILGGPR